MANLEPLARGDLPDFEEYFASREAQGGFVMNSLLIMGRRPEILRAALGFARAVMGPGEVDRQLKQMAAQVASTAAGCRYCQAHTATHAAHAGVPSEKVEALFEFEVSPLFTAAERAALRLARDAAIVPNAVTREHFDDLRRYFSEPQIVELMAAVALFGFFNRWNDSLATELEDTPLSFAGKHLSQAGWEPGKHLRK